MGYLSYFLSTKSFLVYFHPTFCPGNLKNKTVSTITRHSLEDIAINQLSVSKQVVPRAIFLTTEASCF